MNTLVIFLLSSFAILGVLASRLNQQPEHQVSDDLPDGDDPHLVNVLRTPFHFTLVSPEAQQDHD